MNSLKLSPSSRAYQDFLEAFDGLSYRHAFELLAHGGKAAYERPPDAPRKQTTVPRLPCPLDETAEDVILLDQVAAYYASRLAAPESQSARDYLVSRGLDDETLWQRFGIGFSDRTLGLRIPEKNRKQGAELRNRLQAVGVYRPTGREHLNGCITIPIRECGHHSQTSGHVAQIYGRRTEPKAPSETRNLYLARPLAGTFNPAALTSREIILTESILDALTFIRHGSEAGLPLMEATTCLYGGGGLTDEFFEAIRAANIQSVRLAFGSGEAGDFAAAQTAARFKAIGIECHRIRFPQRQRICLGAGRGSPPPNRPKCRMAGRAWLRGVPSQSVGVPAHPKSPNSNHPRRCPADSCHEH